MQYVCVCVCPLLFIPKVGGLVHVRVCLCVEIEKYWPALPLQQSTELTKAARESAHMHTVWKEESICWHCFNRASVANTFLFSYSMRTGKRYWAVSTHNFNPALLSLTTQNSSRPHDAERGILLDPSVICFVCSSEQQCITTTDAVLEMVFSEAKLCSHIFFFYILICLLFGSFGTLWGSNSHYKHSRDLPWIKTSTVAETAVQNLQLLFLY